MSPLRIIVLNANSARARKRFERFLSCFMAQLTLGLCSNDSLIISTTFVLSAFVAFLMALGWL